MGMRKRHTKTKNFYGTISAQHGTILTNGVGVLIVREMPSTPRLISLKIKEIFEVNTN